MTEASQRLYISPRHFIVTHTQLQNTATGKASQLVMDRVSGECKDMRDFNPLVGGITGDQLYFIPVFGLLGLLTAGDTNFIAVITEATHVATMRSAPIFTIKNVEYIPFTPAEAALPELATRQLQGVTRLLTTGFYFSYNYDMTNSLQRQVDSAEGTLHSKADLRFYWNYEMLKDFTLQGINAKWLLPIVQGYVGADGSLINGIDVYMVLISRRSCYRAGTRYNARGIDDDGNVANFVETEQIFLVNDCYFSLVQIRGSVPTFWQQTGVTAAIAVTRSKELTTTAFRKHMASSIRIYKHVSFVNLLSSKSNEQLLTDSLQFQLTQSQEFSQVSAYFFFDFHGMCASNKFSNLRVLLSQVEEMLNYYKFFCIRRGQVVSLQKGVIRINCLDCLDRTNVVMSRIAWHSFVTQFGKIGIPVDFDLDDASLASPFVKSFKNLWADNGDLLSYEYTGTGSTISSVTRNGRQGFKGMIEHGMKSISRFYQANVEDNSRQEWIDLLLKRRGTGSNISLIHKLRSEVFAREDEYSQFTKVTIQICTWNMGGRKPPTHENLLPWLLADSRPDIVIVAFQEIVKLNARNCIPGSNSTNVAIWKDLLSRSLHYAEDEYIPIKSEDMFGCLICFFAKRSIASSLSRIESDKVKTGFKGNLGNKGSVMVRFNIHDTSVCVWNCHLASGNDQIGARCSQLEDIETRGFQREAVGRPKIYRVNDHNVKFLIGDLNYRINLSNFEVRRLIQENDMQSLLQNDQLLMVQPRDSVLKKYIEPPITFLPTYKYDVNTQTFDSSKKARTPGWCDRILYSGSQVYVHSYNRVELLHSDHRPVYATYEIRVKTEDTGRRQIVEQDVYSRIQAPPRPPPPQAVIPQAVSPAEPQQGMFDLLDLMSSPPLIFASEDPGSSAEFSLI